jgi:micrococcal nuclease
MNSLCARCDCGAAEAGEGLLGGHKAGYDAASRVTAKTCRKRSRLVVSKRFFSITPERVYWVVILLLLGAATFFTFQVESRRLKVRRKIVPIGSGQKVQALKAIDGDEVVVLVNGTPQVIRLLGIKAFAPTANEDGIKSLGAAARRRLEQLIKNRELVVEYKKEKRDRHGRLLAYLRAGKTDLGLDLIERGLVMVYTRYPFSRKVAYLTAEGRASAKSVGLWGNAKATMRVQALKAVWEAER